MSPQQTVTHYEVLGKLGQGGMGSVFKARDTKLKRYVALKFLSTDLLKSTKARNYFFEEGKALASLSHPNIATVFEVDEAEGVPFLALEYLRGGTLRERIRAVTASGSLLSVRDVLDWGAALADGLAHAHRHRIVHRDVKSSNVMFDGEGRIKLTDFGLARVTHGGDASEIGAVAGTMGYMSPEQLRGEKADQRSDIFSLGVVIYEMATGRLPFAAESPAAVVQKVLNVEADSVSHWRQEPTPGLDAVLKRLLAKSLKDRYQRADQVARDLRTLMTTASTGDGSNISTATIRIGGIGGISRRKWAALAAAASLLAYAVFVSGDRIRRWLNRLTLPNQKHIAVLPFRNIGGDAAQQAFCDGLTEIVTTALSKRGNLSVVPSVEVRRVDTAEQARKQFGVNLVVYGSVQRRAGQVRLILTLIDASSQRQIDALPMDWPLDRLFELEQGVLTKLADLLNQVQEEPPSLVAAGATQMPAAYDSYLRGRGFYYRYDRAGNLEHAQQQFEEAIRMDPSFAAAYTGLSETLVRASREKKDPALLAAAESPARRALELSPSLPGARVVLGSVLAGLQKFSEAEGEFKAALKLDKQDPVAYRELARLYYQQKRMGEAENLYKKAIQERPGDWMSYQYAATFYGNRQRFQDAEKQLRKAIEITPDNHVPYRYLGGVLLKLNRNGEAEQMMLKAQSLNPTAVGQSNLAVLYIYQKRYKEAVPAAEKAADLAGREGSVEYRIWGNLGDAYWLAQAGEDRAHAAWRKAADMARTRLGQQGGNATVISQLAGFESKLGETKQALEHIEQAVRLEPSNGEIRFRAAQVFTRLDRKERAIDELARALANKFPAEEIRQAPELNPLHNDPKYEKLIRGTSSR